MVVILQKQRQELRGLEAVITSTQDADPPWTFRAIDIEWVVDRLGGSPQSGASGGDRRGEVLRGRGDDRPCRRPVPQRPDRAGPVRAGLRGPCRTGQDRARRCRAARPGPDAADRRRRDGHVVDPHRRCARRMHGGVERARARAGHVDPRDVRGGRLAARPHEHVRREPLPVGTARPRRSRRGPLRGRGRARARGGPRARGRLARPARRAAPAVRPGRPRGGVRRVPGAGGGARRGRRGRARDRDADRRPRARTGGRRVPGGGARRRAPRERDLHARRPHPARGHPRRRGATAARARGRRGGGELR